MLIGGGVVGHCADLRGEGIGYAQDGACVGRREGDRGAVEVAPAEVGVVCAWGRGN